ncbi:hypothetical protein [Cerasicoccus frondis]|uniref:hypothetical protein n=1 Tax=Cerasicoccus frondis TaxID=490090 RepID=UPI002852B306|nr:hypothetical protein [Cerasicoccus frondis]
MKRYVYLAVAMFLALSDMALGNLVAQEDQLYSAELRFFNPMEDTRGLYFMSEGEDQEIRATFNGPSKSYTFKSNSPNLILYRIKKNGAAVERNQVAQIPLPESGGEFLVFMSPNGSNEEDQYLGRVFDDSSTTLIKGNTRIHNLTEEPIAMRYGASEFQVAPSDSKTLRTRSGAKGDNGTEVSIDFPVHIVMNTEGRWRSVYRSIWYPREDARVQVFIMPQSKKAIRVYQVMN